MASDYAFLRQGSLCYTCFSAAHVKSVTVLANWLRELFWSLQRGIFWIQIVCKVSCSDKGVMKIYSDSMILPVHSPFLVRLSRKNTYLNISQPEKTTSTHQSATPGLFRGCREFGTSDPLSARSHGSSKDPYTNGSIQKSPGLQLLMK